MRSGSSRSTKRLRTALIVGELALGTVLVASAALLGSSLDRLRTVDKGFDPHGVVSGRVSTPSARTADKPAWLAFQNEVLARVERLPGVERAALSLLLPLTDRSWELGLTPEGRPFDPHDADSVLFNIVSTGYFDTLGLTLRSGRTFTAAK